MGSHIPIDLPKCKSKNIKKSYQHLNLTDILYHNNK